MLIIVTALGGEIENGLYFNFNFFYFLDSKHGDLVYFSLQKALEVTANEYRLTVAVAIRK